jgi:hypothetical protein
MFHGTIHGFGSSVSLLLSLTPLGLHDARAGRPCAPLSTSISKIVEGGKELAPVFRYVTEY